MEILQGSQLNFNKALLNTHFITSHLKLSLIIHAFVSVFRLKEDHCIQYTPNQTVFTFVKCSLCIILPFCMLQKYDRCNKISYN